MGESVIDPGWRNRENPDEAQGTMQSTSADKTNYQPSSDALPHQARLERMAHLVDRVQQCMDSQDDSMQSWSPGGSELQSQLRLERVANLLDRVQDCVTRQ